MNFLNGDEVMAGIKRGAEKFGSSVAVRTVKRMASRLNGFAPKEPEPYGLGMGGADTEQMSQKENASVDAMNKNLVCPNCEQWARYDKNKGYYDCSNECAKRGFADKVKLLANSAEGIPPAKLRQQNKLEFYKRELELAPAEEKEYILAAIKGLEGELAGAEDIRSNAKFVVGDAVSTPDGKSGKVINVTPAGKVVVESTIAGDTWTYEARDLNPLDSMKNEDSSSLGFQSGQKSTTAQRDDLENILSPDAAKRILEDLSIGMPDSGAIRVDLFSPAEYEQYKEAMLALGQKPKALSNEVTVGDGQFMENSSYKFKYPNGETETVSASSDDEAWEKFVQLTRNTGDGSETKAQLVKMEAKLLKNIGGTHTKCVDCGAQGAVRDMEKNAHGAGYLCKGCAADWNKENSLENADGAKCPICGAWGGMEGSLEDPVVHYSDDKGHVWSVVTETGKKSLENAGHLTSEGWEAASHEERVSWLESAQKDVNLATLHFVDLSQDVRVALQDDVDLPVTVNNSSEKCPNCGGSGGVSYTESCPDCGGFGKFKNASDEETCQECGVDLTKESHRKSCALKENASGSTEDVEREIARLEELLASATRLKYPEEAKKWKKEIETKKASLAKLREKENTAGKLPTFVFKDAQGEEESFTARDEAAAWGALSSDFGVSIEDLKKLGIKFVRKIENTTDAISTFEANLRDLKAQVKEAEQEISSEKKRLSDLNRSLQDANRTGDSAAAGEIKEEMRNIDSQGDLEEIARHAEGIEHEVQELAEEGLANKAGDQLSGADCTCGHSGAKHHDTGHGEACASCDCDVYDPAVTCKKCGQKERQGMAVGGLCEQCQNSTKEDDMRNGYEENLACPDCPGNKQKVEYSYGTRGKDAQFICRQCGKYFSEGEAVKKNSLYNDGLSRGSKKYGAQPK